MPISFARRPLPLYLYSLSPQLLLISFLPPILNQNRATGVWGCQLCLAFSDILGLKRNLRLTSIIIATSSSPAVSPFLHLSANLSLSPPANKPQRDIFGGHLWHFLDFTAAVFFARLLIVHLSQGAFAQNRTRKASINVTQQLLPSEFSLAEDDSENSEKASLHITYFVWLVGSPGTVSHCTFVQHMHYHRSKHAQDTSVLSFLLY